MRLYPYVAPLILTPLTFWLWRGDLTGWLVPILWAYIVPAVGTNVLGMWEFDTRFRLGRFRPHHGFVFGSATSLLGWLIHAWANHVWVYALVLFAVNIAYDVAALRAGILRVYNQPFADGRGAAAIAFDYAPWFFGGFGAIYGFGLVYAMPWWETLALALTLPAAAYMIQSRIRYGNWSAGISPATIGRPARSPRAEPRGRDARTPERLNWILLALSAIVTSALLWAASHGFALLAAIAFALVNNVPFALMHEAVHGVASPHRRRNAAIGVIAACMFPTSFTLQRVAHLGHHARNRTDSDLYDYYLPAQSKLVRNLWLYAGNLLGLYWFCIPVSNALYLLATPLYRSRWFVERLAPKLGFGPHVKEIAQLPPLRVWIEIAAAFGYQTALWLALGLEWKGWLLAHWLFAMHWSALQYVDHAWSARDVDGGAWNLRVFAPVRWLALNYHFHRSHHADPSIPWTRLAGTADASFWRIYFSLWRHGVQPAPPMGAPANRALFAPAEEPA
jgi:fatty acid desaturase